MEKATCTTCGNENPVNYKYCFNCGYEMPKANIITINETDSIKASAKTNSKSKLRYWIFYAVAFGFSYFAVQYFYFGTASIDKNMMKVASQLNESCPMMVDSETRLDNTIALPKKVFQYFYTLVNVDKNEVDPLEIKNVIGPRIANIVKTNPDMKAMRDLNVVFKYSYKDKNGTFLFDVTISPDQYQ
jgi:hypothetical protein